MQYKYLRPEDEEAHRGRGGEQGKLEALQLALTVLQVPPHMCEGLFKVLAAILWLGNIHFEVRTLIYLHIWRNTKTKYGIINSIFCS